MLYDVQPLISAQFDVALYTVDSTRTLSTFAARLPRYRFVAMPLQDTASNSDAFRECAVRTLDSLIAAAPPVTKSLKRTWCSAAPTDAELDANASSMCVWIDEQTRVLAHAAPRRALHIAYSSCRALPLLRVNCTSAAVGDWQLLHTVPPMCALPVRVPCVLANLDACVSPALAEGDEMSAHRLRWLHSWPREQETPSDAAYHDEFVVFELCTARYVLAHHGEPAQVFTTISALCAHVDTVRVASRAPLLLCDPASALAVQTHLMQRFGVVRMHSWLVCNVDEFVLNASLDVSGHNSWRQHCQPALLPHHSASEPFLHYSAAVMRVIIHKLAEARCRWLASYNVADYSVALARMAGMTWSAALQAWPKQVCESLIGTMVAREQQCVVLPLERSKTVRSTYQGGHVESAQRGLHNDAFVALLDSRSHYPSVFIWAKLEPHLCVVFARLVAMRRSEQRAQYAFVLKYLANSLYGGLAVVDYDTGELAAQTAEAGRRALQRAIAVLREDNEHAASVSIVGGDTDALLVKLHTTHTLDDTVAHVQTRLLPALNTALGEPMQFTLQWVARSLYMHTKKQYAYVDARDNTIHTKGMEEIRGNTAEVVKQALSECTRQILLHGGNDLVTSSSLSLNTQPLPIITITTTLQRYAETMRESLTLQADPVQAFRMMPRHARAAAHREPYILVESINAQHPREIRIRDLLDPMQVQRTLDVQYCIEMQFTKVVQRRIETLAAMARQNTEDVEMNTRDSDEDDDDDAAK